MGPWGPGGPPEGKPLSAPGVPPQGAHPSRGPPPLASSPVSPPLG